MHDEYSQRRGCTMTALRKNIEVFVADSQHGRAIVMAMIILLVLSVIGIYAVYTSTVETKIAGVGQGFQEAFYAADAGEPVGTYVTRQILHYDPQTTTELATVLGVQFPSGIVNSRLFHNATSPDSTYPSGKLFSIFTRDLTEPHPDTGTGTNADIIAALSDSQALGLPAYVQLLIKIDRLQSLTMAGGGVEFASGYEGVGLGGGGGVAVVYNVDSVGKYGFWGAESRVSLGYRYVPGVAGGQ
jgi:Tfp pilus assembly protein PilX